jgi:hypothetical protein
MQFYRHLLASFAFHIDPSSFLSYLLLHRSPIRVSITTFNVAPGSFLGHYMSEAHQRYQIYLATYNRIPESHSSWRISVSDILDPLRHNLSCLRLWLIRRFWRDVSNDFFHHKSPKQKLSGLETMLAGCRYMLKYCHDLHLDHETIWWSHLRFLIRLCSQLMSCLFFYKWVRLGVIFQTIIMYWCEWWTLSSLCYSMFVLSCWSNRLCLCGIHSEDNLDQKNLTIQYAFSFSSKIVSLMFDFIVVM